MNLTDDSIRMAVKLWLDGNKMLNISKWNTSEVTDMSYLFCDDIGEWDTSNVVTMRCMFSNASTFNQNISS
jgi:hypothetical protein